MILLCAEEQLEIRDKSRSKFLQGNIADLVSLTDELRQMIIYGTIFPKTALALDFSNLLCIVLIMLTEYGKQCFVVHTHTQEGISYLLCGNIVVLIANILISLVDIHSDFVKHSVSLQCYNTSSRHSSGLDIPMLFIDIKFATEL